VFRLSKLTDYGIVLLAHLAKEATATPGPAPTHTARELASDVDLPVPVVSKILKQLARDGVLDSHRGAKGGYSLTRHPEELTVAEMITALDGPVALTQCSIGPALCEHEVGCAVRSPWQVINQVVHYALAGVTLADLIDPNFPAEIGPLRLFEQPRRDGLGAFDATRKVV
jgi:FeS assembly SUF system regulator